jgi:hypothetical protein
MEKSWLYPILIGKNVFPAAKSFSIMHQMKNLTHSAGNARSRHRRDQNSMKELKNIQ